MVLFKFAKQRCDNHTTKNTTFEHQKNIKCRPCLRDYVDLKITEGTSRNQKHPRKAAWPWEKTCNHRAGDKWMGHREGAFQLFLVSWTRQAHGRCKKKQCLAGILYANYINLQVPLLWTKVKKWLSLQKQQKSVWCLGQRQKLFS